MSQNSQKVENSLNLALSLPESELEKSRNLQTGFNTDTNTWKVIIKYNGDTQGIQETLPESTIVPLYNQYAVVTLQAGDIDTLASLPQVQFVEKPKELYFELDEGRSVSCINSVQGQSGSSSTDGFGLTGQGVLVGIVDTGIAYNHPGFLKEDGTTRILYLWDQEAEAVSGEQPPAGYSMGVEYTAQNINEAIALEKSAPAGTQIRPVNETAASHGTTVAGIAAGNGAGSVGRQYRGVAIESPMIIVKLGTTKSTFPRTTEVMEALDYMVKKAQELSMPIAINVSFGNNYGSHSGDSLFENYIADLANVWKNVIVIASGNEADARHHAMITLKDQMETVSIAIAENERNVTLQIWKQYVDDFAVFIEAPDGKKQQVDARASNAESYEFGNSRLHVFYGEPSPFSILQEIYVEWVPLENSTNIASGIWKILFIPLSIVSGEVNMWLPGIETIGLSTGFLSADPFTTLTIPSTSRNVITVGAYVAETEGIASFSGRGNTLDNRQAPDLVAPGVAVVTALPGGGYGPQTGTSIAAPFVTGSAALLMEWGIVNGNDRYLYGEKVKAYLIKGARRLQNQGEVPDKTAGWGALCLREAFPK